MKEHPETLLLTLAETAHTLRVSRTTIWRMAKRGDLPTVSIGSRVLVPRSALTELSEAEHG